MALIDVTAYGAIGNGIADDTAAINTAIAALNGAGRGVLYFPTGTYKTTSALTPLEVPCVVRGDGPAGFDGSAHSISKITCTSPTATLFTVTSERATFAQLALENIAATTPTAGAAIYASGSTLTARVDYESVTVSGFYINIDVQVGCGWTMRNCWLTAPVRYSVKVRNTVNGDAGDWAISDCGFFGARFHSDAAIRLESSGGGKIVNCKFNQSPGAHRHVRMIDLQCQTQTLILLLSNCSFENYSGDAIHAVGPRWDHLSIHGCQFGQYGNTTGTPIVVTNLNGIVIDACHFIATNGAPYAIRFTTVNRAAIAAVTNLGFSSLLQQTNCTGVIDLSAGAALPAISAASRLLGRGSFGAGEAQDITLGHGAQMIGTTLHTRGNRWDVLTSGGELVLDQRGDVLMTEIPR